MSDTVYFEFEVFAEDYTNAGKVSSEIKRYLQQLGIDSKLIRRVSICSYEAEINLVIHSLGGKIILQINNLEITLISRDIGPGINDIELAMTPGFSTANETAREMGFGAGMGLPNIKKNSDSFFIESSLNGTVIKLTYHI